ncbi:MAG: malonyl-CoA decarboxylase [Gammaproteobacteria bacterium]|jgi:malonyl-CoA decarboxylase
MSTIVPDQEASEGLWDRTLRKMRRAWPRGVAASLKDAVSADLGGDDVQRIRQQIDDCLKALGGEVSARARAAELGETYLVLNEAGRQRFLQILADDYDVDGEAIDTAIRARNDAQDDPAARRRAESHLREALRAPRVALLSQFNALEEGVKFLVDLRAELIPLARADTGLKALDQDVYRLLSSWFDVGFLKLQRITWDSPASLLEKLTKYEAVHAIRSYSDLKNRLGDDRRCYAYFHPQMPDEPLIFVEIALVNGIAGNVHELLDEKAPLGDPERADTAIFYSISNCQKGLAGVSFGNFLIKGVVSDLLRELPNLKTFSTLSPVPGFRPWLQQQLEDNTLDFNKDALQALSTLSSVAATPESFAKSLNRDLGEDGGAFGEDLQKLLMHSCARYLLEARRNDHALDRVAHFHLSNGARIERLNWAGDLSHNGIRQSAGIMVNYLYKLSDIEKNHEAYSSNATIAASTAVRKLVRA